MKSEPIELINQVHRSLPQSLTAEKLAEWVTTHQKQVINHITKTPLTPEEVSENEHKSSAASRAIDRLDEVMDLFKLLIKKGTKYDGTTDKHLPESVTIPGTKGKDALTANRQIADSILEKGYNEETTVLYLIPNPDESQMVAVDIEGHEAPKYSRAMTAEEDKMYGKLFVKEGGELRQLGADEVSVDKYNGTAKIKTKKNQEPFI
jgi:hypothetical protein